MKVFRHYKLRCLCQGIKKKYSVKLYNIIFFKVFRADSSPRISNFISNTFSVLCPVIMEIFVTIFHVYLNTNVLFNDLMINYKFNLFLLLLCIVCHVNSLLGLKSTII